MMKKRIVCMMILIIALVSMSQMAVLAADLSERAKIHVNSIIINEENAADVLGDGSVSYDIENDSLILKDAQLSVIRTEGDLTIVLQGQNCIANTDGMAIDVKGNLTIIGEGSLEAEGVGYGIYSGDNLSISENANVSVKVNSGFVDCYGIYSYMDMNIGENAVVTVEMGAAPKNCYGIYSYDDLTISDNAVVTTKAGYAPERSCGVYAISNLSINGAAAVTTTGVDNESSADAFNDSYGIRTTHLYMNGGTLTASGGKSNACSDGIFTQDFTMTAGTVTATGNTAYKGPSNGIEATKFMTVSGGTIIATGGDTANDKSCGIRTAGTMTITDGVVYANSGIAANTCGIEMNDFMMSGGSVFVSAADGSNSSRGLQASNLISISNGFLDIKSGTADAQSFGLQGFKVEISGGDVIVVNGDANESNGIWAFEGVNVADGTVDITSDGNGIHVPFGSVNIDCTKVTASAISPMLQGTTVKIKAGGNYGIYAGTELTVSDRLESSGILTKAADSYWTFVDAEGKAAKEITIRPLKHDVIIKIPDVMYTMGVRVPVGQSVNETYCEIYGVNDFSEILDTDREGYIFDGWYTDENGTAGNEFTFDDKITEDIIVYPKWKAEEGEESSSPNEPENSEGTDDSAGSNDSAGSDDSACTNDSTGTNNSERPEDSNSSNKPEESSKLEEDKQEEQDKTTSNVNTGDTNNAWMWTAAVLFSVIMLVVMSVIKFESRNETL